MASFGSPLHILVVCIKQSHCISRVSSSNNSTRTLLCTAEDMEHLEPQTFGMDVDGEFVLDLEGDRWGPRQAAISMQPVLLLAASAVTPQPLNSDRHKVSSCCNTRCCIGLT
jgi:hypothetical protein